MSKFLCNRALMLREIGRYREASEALVAAERFDPINPAVADIQYSIEYATMGGDLLSLLSGNGPKFKDVFGVAPVSLPLNLVASNAPPAWSTGAIISSVATSDFDDPSASRPQRKPPLDLRALETSDFAKENARLVNLINESNRNRSAQHPNGNPPTEPLLRQLTLLLQSWKES